MNYPSFRFVFQNAPGLTFTKWYTRFEENLKDRNAKTFLFVDKSVANSCFVRTILAYKTFLNVFCHDDVLEELPAIESNIKRYCENLLIRGAFSECKIEFDSEKYKNLVLRDYNQINLSDMFDESWYFYSQNKPKLFYKLSEYCQDIPFGYIWSLFFTESDTEALVVDDFVVNNSYLFKKNIKLNYEPEENKKYKIIYLDTKGKRININPFMQKLEQNGLLLLKNLDVEGPNMIGWRDMKNKMIGLAKV